MTPPDPPRCIAYLTAEYPAISHTFILREVEALRAAGHAVITCSIRRTPPEQHPGPAEKAAAATTFCVLPAALRPGTLLAAQGAALRGPRRYFGALALAWRMRAPGWKAAAFQLVYFLEATVLARHLTAAGATHLHNHFAMSSATVGMLAARLAGLSFSYTLHGPADLQDPRRWRVDLKTAEARFVACISHFARSQAMLLSDPAQWNKLRIVHCGVAPELYGRTPVAAAGAAAPDRFALLFVGRLAPAKGLRVLVEAFRSAQAAHPGLTLSVVGDGPDRGWLETAAKDSGGAITLLGVRSQTQVATLLGAHDALVLPSFAEGVPVVLMEAMASCRPVIATRIAGVPELVEDGVSGLLVLPGDSATLAAAILRLARDADLCARLGAAGRARVAAEFDIRHEAAWLARLFSGEAGPAIRPPV